jgi:hypothetical protein
MLTCYGDTVRLPQNDLAYVAFRLALQETLTDNELHRDLEDEAPDFPAGYLSEVPFLEQVPLPVQVDLLADTWAKHRQPDLIEASLLDAAVVYAACETAGRIIHDMPEVAVAWLHGGPRKVSARIIKRAPQRLEELFEAFWDDQDFLLIEEFQDLPPDHARQLKDMLRIPDEMIEPMYAALERWNVSPNVAVNLVGLLTDAEIVEAMPLLRPDMQIIRGNVPVIGPGDPGNLLTGLDDRHHGILVGPCNPAAAEAEADCPFVDVIGIGDETGFDCTYEEWVEHFRSEVRQVAQEPVPPTQPTEDAGLAEQIDRARTTGLKDGTRIEARGDDWVVVDNLHSYLVDPEAPSWVVGNDDQEMPPTVSPTAAAAYKAWERSEEVAAARKRRREEALKRLRRTKSQ